MTVLRLQPVVGTTLETPITHLLSAPVVPTVLGFDPQLQFVHEDDSAAVLRHAIHHPVAGAVNIAGDGTVSLSRALHRMGLIALPLPAPLFGQLSRDRRACRPAAADARHGALRPLRPRRRHDAHAQELRFEPRYSTAGAIDAVAQARVAA